MGFKNPEYYTGTEEEKYEKVTLLRDEIERRIDEFIKPYRMELELASD